MNGREPLLGYVITSLIIILGKLMTDELSVSCYKRLQGWLSDGSELSSKVSQTYEKLLHKSVCIETLGCRSVRHTLRG
jgi:hypothetical protein